MTESALAISAFPAATSASNGDVGLFTQGSTGPGTGITRKVSLAQLMAGGAPTMLASPPPIGGTTPGTGAFTSLSSTTGALNGSIGSVTPNPGAFTSVEFNTPADSRLWSYVTADTALEYKVGGTTKFSVSDTGALTTLGGTWSDTSSVIGSAASFWFPNYFGNVGTGVVSRFNRLKVGAAALSSADRPMTTPSWLNTYFPGTAEGAQVMSISTIGGTGVQGASRSSDYRTWAGAATGGAQGVNGFAINDDTGSGGPIAAGVLGAGFNLPGVSGIALGAQFGAMNSGSVTTITPAMTVTSGMSIAVLATSSWLPAFTNNITAAIVVGAGGPARSQKGLVFLSTALDTTFGTGGRGVAIELGNSQSIRWLSDTNVVSGEMYGSFYGLVIASPLIRKAATADQSTDVYIATAAGSRTIPNGCSWECLTPAGTIATFTTTMPAAPIDGQEVWINTTQTITTWTLSANTGQTINGAPATLAANTSVMFRYNLASTAWFRMV